jgi:hypothetical protein
VEAEFSLGSYSDEESDMDAVHEDGSAGGVGSKYVKQVDTATVHKASLSHRGNLTRHPMTDARHCCR